MKCSFCNLEIPKGTGKMFVKIDGKIFYFCSNKCEKNTNKLNRKPRLTKWSNEYQNIKHGRKPEAKKDD
jgi:large subunit ribosomal protein L24e